jgi:hypothetical protein
VFSAYDQECERSRQPGYVPPNLDHEDLDSFDMPPSTSPVGRMQPSIAAH